MTVPSALRVRVGDEIEQLRLQGDRFKQLIQVDLLGG